MKQFLIFLIKIESFCKLYQNYGYDGETVEFIIDNYERVLCNRTKTMSKPTYYLEDVLRELDNWYEEMGCVCIERKTNQNTTTINSKPHYRLKNLQRNYAV